MLTVEQIAAQVRTRLHEPTGEALCEFLDLTVREGECYCEALHNPDMPPGWGQLRCCYHSDTFGALLVDHGCVPRDYYGPRRWITMLPDEPRREALLRREGARYMLRLARKRVGSATPTPEETGEAQALADLIFNDDDNGGRQELAA